MKAIRQKDGSFQQLVGNPTLLSLDGTEKATWFAILSMKREADFGVEEVEIPVTPEGKIIVDLTRIIDVNGKPQAEYAYVDAPVKVELTKSQQLEASIGLTIAEIKEVLGIGNIK